MKPISMKTKFTASTMIMLITGITALTTGCSSNDSPGNEGPVDPSKGGTRYVISAKPINQETGSTDYLLTTEDITQGSISTIGNGVEQVGAYRYYITINNQLNSLMFGQGNAEGNPGDVTTDRLKENGALLKTRDLSTETVQAFSAIGNDLLLAKVPPRLETQAIFYLLPDGSNKLQTMKNLELKNFTGNGELGQFGFPASFGDKLLLPVYTVKGVGSAMEANATSFPDSTWVAVLSYPELEVEKIIRDDRTGFLGDYHHNSIFVDERGDAYGYSSAAKQNERPSGEIVSKKQSAFVRIKKGTTEFDKDFFYNFEEKSGGYKIKAARYVGNGKFIVQTTGERAGADATHVKFAAVDVYNSEFHWFDGVPATATSNWMTPETRYYGVVSADKTKAYIGVREGNNSYVYEFDVNSHQAKKGLEVKGAEITSINELTY